jgi:hypothetical protein
MREKLVEVSVEVFNKAQARLREIEAAEKVLHNEESKINNMWQCYKCNRCFTGWTDWRTDHKKLCDDCGSGRVTVLHIQFPEAKEVEYANNCKEQGSDHWPSFEIEAVLNKTPIESRITLSDALHIRDVDGNNIITIDTSDDKHFNIFSDYVIEVTDRKDVFIARKKSKDEQEYGAL